MFLPVGMSYLALLGLSAAVLADRRTLEFRWVRMLHHPIWWPTLAFVGWSLVVLVGQEHWFDETPSNGLHIIRIALTLMLGVILDRDELLWALRGLVAAFVWAAGVLLIHEAVGLPMWTVWRGLLNYHGNKSISNALLLAIAAGFAGLCCQPRRSISNLVAFGVIFASLFALVFMLPNRTALLALLIGGASVVLHVFRSRPLVLVVLIFALVGTAAVGVASFPVLSQRLMLGFTETQAAIAGIVDPNKYGSWSIRVLMYQTTLQMLLEQPFTGNGIGAWNSLWNQRVPAELAGFNMPHSDYLLMGAQAGWMGLLTFSALLMTGWWQGWQRRDLAGRALFFVTTVVCVAAAFNSAARDAHIGLELLWVLGLLLNLGQQPEDTLSALATWRVAGEA